VNHNLLRIAQEASTNAFRHARARRISIRLEYGGQEVSLEITDDGVGFRPAEVLKNNDGHLGLRGMRARAKKLRGTLEIASEPGEGARLRVVVPATKEQATPENAEAKHDS
jgi:signal transduction histidine kinase